MNSRYFSGFDSLRFVAAALVVLSHAAITVNNLGAGLPEWPILHKGGIAVEFFFTLSGFLITYLLLGELEKTATIDIKAFYLRRVYRIWPLYFIIVLAGFVIFELLYPRFLHTTYFTFPSVWQGLFLYLFFLPNFAATFFKVGLLYPLWSIGVEEQFYLVWAPMIRYLRRYLVQAICAVVVLSIFLSLYGSLSYAPADNMGRFIGTLKFHCMGVGGIFAYLLHRGIIDEKNGWLRHSLLLAAVAAAALASIFLDLSTGISAIDEVVRSVIFSLVLIITVARVTTQNRLLGYLGKISYGIYMYHMLVDYMLRTVVQKTASGSTLPPLALLMIYFVTLLMSTVALAGLSYKFIEQPILQRGKTATRPAFDRPRNNLGGNHVARE